MLRDDGIGVIRTAVFCSNWPPSNLKGINMLQVSFSKLFWTVDRLNSYTIYLDHHPKGHRKYLKHKDVGMDIIQHFMEKASFLSQEKAEQEY
eukprot:14554826-Ditylum_brightwellii.AAC.1